MKKAIAVITGLILFTGCAPKVEYQTIYKTKTVYLKPSDNILTDDIILPTPPNKEEFINARPMKREQMLTFYIIDLLKTIKKYKVKNKNIIEWYNAVNTKNGKGN